MNVLIIGKPKYNHEIFIEKFLKEKDKISFNEKIEEPGGVSVYIATMLKKWGVDVCYGGAICGDEYGNKIKDYIESIGIDTKYLEADYEHHTGINYMLVNKENGLSTEILEENNLVMQKYKYDIVPDYIITDGTDIGAAMGAINNYPNAKLIMLANVLSGDYLSLTKRSAHVCANARFASSLSQIVMDYKAQTLVDIFQKIKDLNKANYIIMLGDKGVLYEKNREVKMLKAVATTICNDSNSTPAFFGAYVYGILKNIDMDIVAKMANTAASMALTKKGFLESIPSKEEVFSKIEYKEELPNEEGNLS